MAQERHDDLPVEAIDFDTQNPRIKMALEKYGDKLNAQRIHFALRSAVDNGGSGSSFERLRESIIASGGVQSPITVVESGERYLCIDGNTRLAIYKDFLKQGTKGDWSRIKATILLDATQRDIETRRVSAHLIGAREWPAYEKARYLHYLRNQEFLEYSEMIALCGGNANRVEIERQIDAFEDMNDYYRDRVDDTAFKINRFSSFVELQKPHVKNAIFSAGFDLEDFGEWIRDSKIFRNADVRLLRTVLSDEKAREAFVSGGPKSIEAANEILKQTSRVGGRQPIDSASLGQLAQILSQKIADLKYADIRNMKDGATDGQPQDVQALQDLNDQIVELLAIVSE